MSDLERTLAQLGRVIDERTRHLADAFNSIASGMSNAFASIQPHPLAEASALKDLAREHDLDAVERNSVRVERAGGALRATYHDGDGWQPVTVYRTNARCSTDVIGE